MAATIQNPENTLTINEFLYWGKLFYLLQKKIILIKIWKKNFFYQQQTQKNISIVYGQIGTEF